MVMSRFDGVFASRLQNGVEEFEVVDAVEVDGLRAGRLSSACLAENLSDAAIGSLVKRRFFHAAVMIASPSFLPVSFSIAALAAVCAAAELSLT